MSTVRSFPERIKPWLVVLYYVLLSLFITWPLALHLGQAVVGGLGNGFGAVVGGLVLGLLEALSKGLISSGYARAIALGVALLVLWLRPQGLLGRRR